MALSSYDSEGFYVLRKRQRIGSYPIGRSTLKDIDMDDRIDIITAKIITPPDTIRSQRFNNKNHYNRINDGAASSDAAGLFIMHGDDIDEYGMYDLIEILNKQGKDIRCIPEECRIEADCDFNINGTSKRMRHITTIVARHSILRYDPDDDIKDGGYYLTPTMPWFNDTEHVIVKVSDLMSTIMQFIEDSREVIPHVYTELMNPDNLIYDNADEVRNVIESLIVYDDSTYDVGYFGIEEFCSLCGTTLREVMKRAR